MVVNLIGSRSSSNDGPAIGVLALQGAFSEHIYQLNRIGVRGVEIRKPEQLNDVQGLIIPGGESTTVGLIAQRWGLVAPLQQWVRAGLPTWGTCAGMILLADRTVGQKQGGQISIGGLDVTVNRNYFGRQVDSFQTYLDVPAMANGQVEAVFIRAPAVIEKGPNVEVLATLPGQADVIVAVRQGHILATAFHPELTTDTRWHYYFADMVCETAQ